VSDIGFRADWRLQRGQAALSGLGGELAWRSAGQRLRGKRLVVAVRYGAEASKRGGLERPVKLGRKGRDRERSSLRSRSQL